MGVKRAMAMVLEEVEHGRGPLFTFGPLIHNPQALALLEEKGVQILEDIPGHITGTVIIRTHGIPPDIRRSLVHCGARLCDATCPKVTKIHSIVKRHVGDGDTVVIVGDKGHAEVSGLMGVAGKKGVVVSDKAEAESVASALKNGVVVSDEAQTESVVSALINGVVVSDKAKTESVASTLSAEESASVCLVAQTTQHNILFSSIVEIFGRVLGECKVYNTICRATTQRQQEVLDLARSVDAMVVVGGYGSANTTRLVSIARGTGVPTYHIEEAEELDRASFALCDTVGVMAGASTPTWVTGQVVACLESY